MWAAYSQPRRLFTDWAIQRAASQTWAPFPPRLRPCSAGAAECCSGGLSAATQRTRSLPPRLGEHEYSTARRITHVGRLSRCHSHLSTIPFTVGTMIHSQKVLSFSNFTHIWSCPSVLHSFRQRSLSHGASTRSGLSTGPLFGPGRNSLPDRALIQQEPRNVAARASQPDIRPAPSCHAPSASDVFHSKSSHSRGCWFRRHSPLGSVHSVIGTMNGRRKVLTV